jgi:hypothetical protein
MVVTLLILSALALVGCSDKSESATSKTQPAYIEVEEGTGINRVILTERAAQRLDVQTVPVREEQVDGESRLVIPYAAVLYDLSGGTWIYVSPEPLIFVRQAITVDYIEGDNVILSEGPPVGTQVAMVAVAELYGIDTGVGK